MLFLQEGFYEVDNAEKLINSRGLDTSRFLHGLGELWSESVSQIFKQEWEKQLSYEEARYSAGSVRNKRGFGRLSQVCDDPISSLGSSDKSGSVCYKRHLLVPQSHFMVKHTLPLSRQKSVPIIM